MILSAIQIRHYRSIKELELSLVPRCRVLIGRNESGKSNLLNALSLLDKTKNPTDYDVRMPFVDELPVTEAFVRFVFDVDKKGIDNLYKKTQEKVLSKKLNVGIINVLGDILTLRQYVNLHKQVKLNVDILKKTRGYILTGFEDEPKLLGSWKKPSSKCPEDFMVIDKEGASVPLKQFSLINAFDNEDIDEAYLHPASIQDLFRLVKNEIVNLIESEMTDCIYWKYSSEYLLPPEIKLDDFATDPNICIPLKNMFELAGYSNISEVINDAKQRPKTELRNLLNRIATKATEQFQSIWKEYGEIEFELIPNGPNIDASVKDIFNRYEFSQRSDGFKRFVTFLLMISSKVRAKTLKNILLLIDEPDISLHPSACRRLRDELIKLAEKNYVLYATHSIHMIDKELIERHIILERENEKTNVKNADKSNILEEEVIYNSIGYSIFEGLEKRNILFEGWRDKELFKVALSRVPAEYKEIKGVFKNIGQCHAKGVKDIRHITPLLELANRECIIISDNDKISKEKQEEFNRIGGYGDWKTYDDIMPDIEAVTGEDFIKVDVFHDPINNIISEYSSLSKVKDADLLHSRGKIYALKSWMNRAKLKEEEKKDCLEKIKEMVFSNLKPSNIEEKYYKFLKQLAKQIQKQS